MRTATLRRLVASVSVSMGDGSAAARGGGAICARAAIDVNASEAAP
jgi:hypothetical protein